MTSADKSAEIAIAKTQKLSTMEKNITEKLQCIYFLSADEKNSYNWAMYLLSTVYRPTRRLTVGGFNVTTVYDYKLHLVFYTA